MGVPGLWPLLAPSEVLPLAALAPRFAPASPSDTAAAGPSSGASLFGAASRAVSAVSEAERGPGAPFILGIDVSAWLYHARASAGGANASLRLLFFRLLRLLSQPHLVPLFIFDGALRPRLKRGAQRRTNEWGETRALKELLDALGMAWREAPGEAEAELAALNARGEVDGVMSDDVDALLFGATLLVRNWSSAISSGAGVSSDSSRPASPSKPSAPSAPPSPRKQKPAPGGQASVAVFRASQLALADFKLDREGLILVALMSGGDYDVQGLMRCGVRIAIGLAAAGFGARLVSGFRRHSTPPSRAAYVSSGGLPVPSMQPAWSVFLAEWLADLRAELRDNPSGCLSTRQAKLAGSQAMQTFLGDPKALAVLNSYVYPLVSPASSSTSASAPVTLRAVDLHALLRTVRVALGWGEEACLRRCRSLAWEGMVLRQLEREGVAEEPASAGQPARTTSARATVPKRAPRRALYASPTATRISDFFAAASLASAGAADEEEAHQASSAAAEPPRHAPRATLVELHSTRQGVSGVEVRAEWDVSAFVAHARHAIADSEDAWRVALLARRAAEAERAMEESDDSEAEQGQRRVPKAVDHDATMRLWIPRHLLSSSSETRALLKTWERKRVEKEQSKAEAERRKTLREEQNARTKGQSTLEAFLRPNKEAAASAVAAKASGSHAGRARPRTPPRAMRKAGSAAHASKAPLPASASSSDDDVRVTALARAPGGSHHPRPRHSPPRRSATSSDELGEPPSENESLAEAWARSPSPTSRRLEDALLRRSGWPGTNTTASAAASASSASATPRASSRATAPAMRAQQPRPLSSSSDSESDISFPSLGTLHAAGASRALARQTAATTAAMAATAATAPKSPTTLRRQDEHALPPPRKSPRKDAAQQSARAARAERAAHHSPRHDASTRPSARVMAEEEAISDTSSSYELLAAPAVPRAAKTAAATTAQVQATAQGKRAKKPVRARVSQAIVLSDSD